MSYPHKTIFDQSCHSPALAYAIVVINVLEGTFRWRLCYEGGQSLGDCLLS